MRPYYEHGGIMLYLGDCREVLPALAEESVDIVLTDPPYGMAYEGGWREKSHGPILGDEDKTIGHDGIRLALRVLRRHRHLYAFGRWDFTGMACRPAVELVWDKGSMSGGDVSLPWGKCHEYIQFATKADCRYDKERQGALAARIRRGSVLSYARRISDDHPSEKPLLLLRELIESSSRIGETVLDPFAGVGSVLISARLEGRKAIGIELSEEHCERAARRLAQEVLPLETATP